MKFFLIGMGALIMLLAAYWGIRLYLGVQVSKKLIDAGVPYEKRTGDFSKAMLVLGDSTAVGVGADRSEDTLAALVSAHVGASSVENYAVSGAMVEDLPPQIARASQAHYALILIQVGANDIVAGHAATPTAAHLGALLDTLPESDNVVIVSAGDVGGAPLLPPPTRPFYTWLNLRYHDAFAEVAHSRGMRYVNLYEDPSTKTITDHPEIYLAADQFHPSTKGYMLWFKAIEPSL